MNPVTLLLGLAALGLASLVAVELRPQPDPAQAALVAPAVPPVSAAASAPAEVPAANPAGTVETLLARPLFSQTRRPPEGGSPTQAVPSSATPLPRMTAILIDGPRRSAIFASAGSKPTVVAEGGRIGPFTVQSIEPEQVVVTGPEGKRTVRTSFDPTLQPPPVYGLAVPQFPGIVVPGAPGSPPISPPQAAPAAGYGLPQTAGAAR